jgi:hypothetical protein
MSCPRAHATVISLPKAASRTMAPWSLSRPTTVSSSALLPPWILYQSLLTLLVAVDIINVVSVTGQGTVTHWLEENDEEILNNLYWRQALDVRNFELSVCYCPRFLAS